MKDLIAWGVIASGVLIGVMELYLGLRRGMQETEKFKLRRFIKKGMKRTRFEDFTGKEQTAFGVLCLFSALSIFVMYFLL
jgi:hypothetical protein